MGTGMDGKGGYTASEIASIVEPIARRHNVISVYLFGSRATGKNGPDSDYDFILETTDDFSFSDYCGFIDELSEALGRPVDIVDRSCLTDDGFSRRVRREEVHVWG
jgi:hypothetical protein